MSYSSRVTHFGLGEANGVDSLIVSWPSGTVDHHGPLAANRMLHLVEGGLATAVVEAMGSGVVPAAIDLAEAYPNPFNASAVLRFDLPSSGRVRLAVYNSLGQSVRTADQVLPAGTHRVTWDGRDQAGAQAASGIYYARLEALAERRVASMVLLR